MAEVALDSPITRDNAPDDFPKLFYPWLIHPQDGAAGWIPRILIERQIGEWYEVGSPAISKALGKLGQPPLALIAIDESKNSGCEKTIRLTDAGMDFMARVSEIVDREFEPGKGGR